MWIPPYAAYAFSRKGRVDSRQCDRKPRAAVRQGGWAVAPAAIVAMYNGLANRCVRAECPPSKGYSSATHLFTREDTARSARPNTRRLPAECHH